MNLDNKFILDACCGGRMFWINKKHPNTLYIDNRTVEIGHIDQRGRRHCVKPDLVMDFRSMDLPDEHFRLIVWDPPHLKTLTKTSILRKKNGSLNAETWQADLKQGFSECWRVLRPYGVLIFKWSETEIRLNKVIGLFSQKPLFGHPIMSKTRTHWLCFMKIPDN